MSAPTNALSILLKRAGKESKNLIFFYGFIRNKTQNVFADLDNSETWDEFLTGGQELLAARVNGKVFLPDRSLKPMGIYKNDQWNFKLSQFGKEFSEMSASNSVENPLEIELFPRGKIRGFLVQSLRNYCFRGCGTIKGFSDKCGKYS